MPCKEQLLSAKITRTSNFKSRCDMLNPIFANLFVEAGIVGIFTLVFLILFVVAGIRQKLKDSE